MVPCRSFALLVCAALLGLYPGLLPAALSVTDQTVLVQQMIDVLPPAGVLDCQGSSYLVSALQLKSNMTLQNCYFQTTPGAVDFAAPVTVDGRSQPIANVLIRNVNVYGNRGGQTNIGYSGQENGGRHCFRILGYVSNLLVENSTGSYCAGDGIAFVSYGVSSSDNPADLPFQNVTVRNSSFTFNRRQGASADGINNLTFENVVFSNNGTTIPGGLEGDQCTSAGDPCFGTGFWYEDYRAGTAGEGLSNVVFSRCIFRDNFQRSVYFLTRELPSAPGYQPRTGIQILNSYMDAGIQPLTEDYAVQFQVDPTLNALGPVFQNITIQNTSLDGSLGFHQVQNAAVISSVITTSLQWLGYAADATDISFVDVQPVGKQLSAALDPWGQSKPVVTYSTSASNEFGSVGRSTREPVVKGK